MKSRILKVAVGIAVALATVGSLAACGSGNTTKKEVIVNMPANSTTALTVNYNPFSGTCLLGTWGALYQTLFWTNPYGDQAGLIPLLGKSYEMAADGKSVTVTLRDDAKWSDGQQFNADDVVFTYNLMKNNKTLNTGGFDGTVTKTGDYSFEITYPKPSYQGIPQLLAGTYIVPEHIWKDVKDPVNTTNADAVGTGPMTVKGGSFTSMAYTWKWNEYSYYTKENPQHVDGVRYAVYTSPSSQQNDLFAGKTDWTGLTIQNYDTLVKGKAIQQVNIPTSQYSFITCSNKDLGCEGPITDPAVRQAIFYGIDRTQINKLAFQNTYSKINASLYPATMFQQYFDSSAEGSPAPMTADQAKAESILKDAGYTKGSDGIYQKDGQQLKFNVPVISAYTDWVNSLQVMTQQLKTIGIELDPQMITSNEYTALQQTGQINGKPFSLTVFGVYAIGGPDPYNFFNYWFNGKNGEPYDIKVGDQTTNNFARVNDPVINDALTKLSQTGDETVKKEQWSILQQETSKIMAYIPIMTQGSLVQNWTDKITNWPTQDNLYANPVTWSSPDDGIILATVKKK